jgi:hypothetical protein
MAHSSICSRNLPVTNGIISKTYVFDFSYHLVLGAFAKLRKATISFDKSAWNNSAPNGRILMKLGI